jgi:hypothetical protein
MYSEIREITTKISRYKCSNEKKEQETVGDFKTVTCGYELPKIHYTLRQEVGVLMDDMTISNPLSRRHISTQSHNYFETHAKG